MDKVKKETNQKNNACVRAHLWLPLMKNHPNYNKVFVINSY